MADKQIEILGQEIEMAWVSHSKVYAKAGDNTIVLNMEDLLRVLTECKLVLTKERINYHLKEVEALPLDGEQL